MKYIKHIIILGLLLSLPIQLFAEGNINPSLEKAYNKFSLQLERKYGEEKKKQKLVLLYGKLNKLIYKKKYSQKQLQVINDLKKIINEDIFQDQLDKQYLKGKIQLKGHQISAVFKNKLYNEEYIFLENGIWYSYFFNQHLYFDNTRNISSRDLEHNGINPERDLIFLSTKGKLGFATKFEKRKLIKDSLIFGIPNKFELLTEIRDDKLHLTIDTDLDYLQLKNITKKITNGKTDEEKIEIIYEYILNNIEYTRNINLEDKRIFSGIHTYKNKDGVCEGYTKLLMYMLNFADIRDAEVIRGFVIDAEDFPQIGHAWVRVGNKYYDPTFDDPITNGKTRTKDQYKYFGLPKDLFYTNRYDYGINIDHLKKLDLETRKSIVVKNLSRYIDKYKSNNYNILAELQFKSENKLSFYKKIQLTDLKNIIPTRNVKDFLYKENNKYIRIESLNYFPISNDTTERLLKQINYNLNGYELLIWTKDDGSIEYRLAYDIVKK